MTNKGKKHKEQGILYKRSHGPTQTKAEKKNARTLRRMQQPSDITIANAESRMSTFIKYYKGIELVPEEEFKDFLTALLSPVPLSFRICRQNRICNNFLEAGKGTISQSDLIRDYIKENYISKVEEVELDDTKLEVNSLPWYPNEYGWVANFANSDMKKKEVLRNLNDLLLTETAGFHVLRQDISTLLPVVLMDFKPNHKILDMCSAPGWMAAQISEQLYSDPGRLPDGFLVCNDTDTNKFQWRWTQGSNCLFVNKDARAFPDLYMAEPNTPRNKIAYDRVICDVPCSNDGNMRKNEDLRDKWAVTTALEMHKVQKGILKRGLEVLGLKGQLLYMTTSLNPVENEGVVAGVLKEAKGKVELVDVRSKLKDFTAREGMTTWKVMSNGLVFYESEAEAPDWFKEENELSVFPPAESEVAALHLDRCLRVLPHDNDTGGFFCAVFTKKGGLAKDFAPPLEPEAAGDSVDHDKQKYVKPIRCNTDISVTMLEWTTETTKENGETDSFSETKTFDVPEMTISACSYPKGKLPEKYVDEMLQADDKIWQQAKAHFKVSDKINPKFVLRRGKENWPGYYYMHPTVKSIMDSNAIFKEMKKFKNFGLKIFSTFKSDLVKDCELIPCESGIVGILPYIGARKVDVTKEDLLLMLQEKTVALDKLAETTKTAIEETEPGCLIFQYKPDGSEESPKCPIVIVGWRNKTFIKDHIESKIENYHIQRLCGVEPLEKKGAGGYNITSQVKIKRVKDCTYEESETIAMVTANLKPTGK